MSCFEEEMVEGYFDPIPIKPLPFKIRYLWAKDPCETCLVKACCLEKYLHSDPKCEIKFTYKEKKSSVRNFFKHRKIYTSLIIIGFIFLILVVIPIWIWS